MQIPWARRYTRASPYATWADIIKQFLSQFIKLRKLTNESAAVQQLLAEQIKEERVLQVPPRAWRYAFPYARPRMRRLYIQMAWLLNPLLDINIPPTAAGVHLGPADRDNVIRVMLSALVIAMCALSPTIVIIDDAHYMHPRSWDLALALAAAAGAPAGCKGALPLSLVLALRPMQARRAWRYAFPSARLARDSCIPECRT